MKNKAGLLVAILILCTSSSFQTAPKPKLVVLIAIDGLRGDLLDKNKASFRHGYKRLIDEGFEFTNAWVDHAVTVSHAGHVTLATGNYPKTHGIVDAAFYVKSGDSLVFTEGFEDPVYKISTGKVLTPGLAEWIKDAKEPGKVLCAGTGNISSALYCFHRNENVFWYSYDDRKYLSSPYFVEKDPQWLTDFNNKNPNIPYSDKFTLALTKRGIESMSLGKTKSTDYVSVVLSEIDNVAHMTGPGSKETFNTLLMQDEILGDFFNFLDEKIGKDSYVVALSSDHGFAEVPEQTQAKGKWADRLTEDEVEKVMTEVAKIRKRNKDKSERIKAVKAYLMQQEFVADVYTPDQLNDGKDSGDKYLELYKKSHRDDRVPRLPYFSLKTLTSEIARDGMMIRLKENAMLDFDTVIHGSAYDYDRFVPLIFFGAGVKQGSSDRKVRTIDVAPTLAKLGGVKMGNKVDGEPLF